MKSYSPNQGDLTLLGAQIARGTQPDDRSSEQAPRRRRSRAGRRLAAALGKQSGSYGLTTGARDALNCLVQHVRLDQLAPATT
jgi:hypothetical protein